MKIVFNALAIAFITVSLTPALAASSYTAERLKCMHRSYLIQKDGSRKPVKESKFDGLISFSVDGSRHDFSIERYRWSPPASYTRAMEQLNPTLPQSAPATDRVSVGDFKSNSKGDRVSSRAVNYKRGRSYGSTIVREHVAVTINATDISIAVKDRLTERWAGDATYIRTATCRFTDANEAAIFMRATQ